MPAPLLAVDHDRERLRRGIVASLADAGCRELVEAAPSSSRPSRICKKPVRASIDCEVTAGRSRLGTVHPKERYRAGHPHIEISDEF